MMISCPSCSTRYSLPGQQLTGDGLAINCIACGHGWIESRALELVDISPRAAVHNLPTVIEHAPEADSEIKRLVEASHRAGLEFAAKKRQRLARIRNWGILAACVMAPVAAAAAFPSKVVTLAPVSVHAYEAMGYDVNIYGLAIARIEQQHVLSDGVRVLTIKGEITNITGSPQKIPWLRFGLMNASKSEIYHWTLDAGARPLKAGETTGFVTRVASPPETARDVQIRFAHLAETGSNTAP